MGRMIDGVWKPSSEYKQDERGRFQRDATTFRELVRDEPGARFAPEAGRYHLYVAYACPWASRALIARSLLGLEPAISVSVVDPFMGENGWAFGAETPGATPDHVNGMEYLWQVYTQARPDFTGRVTVPVLWDRRHETIVNNESRDILRMFSTVLRPLGAHDVDLAPESLRPRIDEVIEALYQPVNNGVYRTGFAGSQEAYEEAFDELFAALDHWESVLSRQRWLCGDRFTEADICLFTTLYRFDAVYHTHFKCNLRRLIDYPSLWDFTREVYQTPRVRAACRLDHVKQHYYRSHDMINPRRIVAKGPIIDFDAPHDRARLPGQPVP